MRTNSTKEHIIEVASDLFYNRGYNLVGINEIIKKSGIAKATLYSHFKSKEDLCISYLDSKDSELLSQLRDFCDSKPFGENRLLAVLQFLMQFYKKDGFNGCWCIRTLAEIAPDNDLILKKIRANKTIFLDFIHSLVKENMVNLDRASQKSLARRLYLLYEGAVTESHLHQDPWPIKESISFLKKLLE